VFGRAVQRALHPERTIVGCADPDARSSRDIFAVLSAFGCPILRMRYESADWRKSRSIVASSPRSAWPTAFEICENIGADWSEIVPALKLDARMASSLFGAGLGIAGGNLERDLATVRRAVGAHHTRRRRARMDRQQQAAPRLAARTIRSALLDAKRMQRVRSGAYYKENTHSIKNSPSLATIAALPEADFIVPIPSSAPM